ncbi:MAG: chemotaxis response regulator protein-glutamate methylesterase [Deltaproteobacteria bacterium]|nr:chemotaxis response regulator protein-glutamate methylesterase [Deltaproteobacteria bacterium]MBW2446954.1 chemotaxis response regulator protein-glutamate methylesterase [Deltaproteobacteria bacterium]
MKERGLIRVLVIDDSAFSRRTITRMLETSPLVKVVGSARDGEEALQKVFKIKPDLITLDLDMPRMDGFTFLRLVMAKMPTPVMVISGRAGEDEVFKALDLGAVDFIAKPTPRPIPELETIQQEVIRKVHAIRQLRIDKVKQRVDQPAEMTMPPHVSMIEPSVQRVVAVGSSTGGPAALMQVFGSFAEPPPCAILISQHMPQGFTKGFAERIDRLTCLTAREARDGDLIQPGTVLIAPGGKHLELESVAGQVATRLEARSAGEKYAPSVDRLFRSAAKAFGRNLQALVLTGMGNDGRDGVLAVKQHGGTVIAESEETAVIFGMPAQAIQTGAVDAILPLGEIGKAIQDGIAPSEGSIGKGSQ